MSKQKKLFASGIFNIYNLHMCKDMCHARGGGEDLQLKKLKS